MSIKQHIPNWLTYLRYVIVPLFLVSWYLPIPYSLWLPVVLVLIGCLTDFFDGYLARKWKVESEIGRLLDPNADKLLVAAGLIMLTVHNYANPIAVIVIMCRELFVSGLREFMAERNIVVHVTKLAKWKTTTQMIAVIILLYSHSCGCINIQEFGRIILWVATMLTALTGLEYFKNALPHLKK